MRAGSGSRSTVTSANTSPRTMATFPPLTAVRWESPLSRMATARSGGCHESSPTASPATSDPAAGGAPSSDCRRPVRMACAIRSTGPGSSSTVIAPLPLPPTLSAATAPSRCGISRRRPVTSITVPGGGTPRPGPSARIIGTERSTDSPRALTRCASSRTSTRDDDCHTGADPSTRTRGSPATSPLTTAVARASIQDDSGAALAEAVASAAAFEPRSTHPAARSTSRPPLAAPEGRQRRPGDDGGQRDDADGQHAHADLVPGHHRLRRATAHQVATAAPSQAPAAGTRRRPSITRARGRAPG